MTATTATARTLLQVNTSARSAGSISKQLADELSARLAAPGGVRVVVRDLSQQPHPALDESTLGALFTPAGERSAAQAARVALDDALIAEVKAAETLVIAAPMYNFGVSVQLKNWIDAIARARETFRYTERGAEGLLVGKKVYIVLTRGGRYRGSPADTQVPYLKTVLAFLGMTDVEFIYAEGLSMGAEAERAGIESARAEIDAAVA